MDRGCLFPDAWAEGRDDRVRVAWCLDYPLPMPAKPLVCPVEGGRLAVKDWKFHKRENVGSAAPWRCDVRMKCMRCGYVPQFGVAVPRAMYETAHGRFGLRASRTWLHWREGKRVLADAGYFEEAECRPGSEPTTSSTA